MKSKVPAFAPIAAPLMMELILHHLTSTFTSEKFYIEHFYRHPVYPHVLCNIASSMFLWMEWTHKVHHIGLGFNVDSHHKTHTHTHSPSIGQHYVNYIFKQTLRIYIRTHKRITKCIACVLRGEAQYQKRPYPIHIRHKCKRLV